MVNGSLVGLQVVGDGSSLALPVLSSEMSTGSNTIEVVVNSGIGQCALVDTLDTRPLVNVKAGVAPVINPGVANLCAGTSTVLSVIDDPSASYQWYINGNTLVGATNASVTAYIEGLYTVDVLSAGCGGTSSAVDVVFDDVNAVSPTISQFSASPQILQADQQGGSYAYQWYVDYKGTRLAIVGATGATYTPLYNGLYYVSINSAGAYCTRVSGLFNVTGQVSSVNSVRFATTGSSIYIPVEDVFVSSVEVLPNPAMDDFHVYYRSGTIGSVIVELVDMNGKSLSQSEVYKGTYELVIPFEGMDQKVNAGIYIVRITEGENVEYSKVVVE